MKFESSASIQLAPLQRVMLGDSLAAPDAGHHVEQVEIVFAPGGWRDRVAAAWEETVARTEALRIAFSIEEGEPAGAGFVASRILLQVEETLPAAWEAWLAADRCRPLLASHQVPWRATYWPHAGHFLWTFHHALLDGRSITTVLRGFLTRLAGGTGEDLVLSKWRPPSAASLALAEKMFREDFPGQEPEDSGFLPDESDRRQALGFPGDDLRKFLEAAAVRSGTTIATLLVWAWGQALAESSRRDSVIVEQVRCGAPQPGTAGFTMLTLPVVIHRAAEGGVETSLREFHSHLLALRTIEGVSPADFPPGVYPDVDRAGSSVIMVEHATPEHLLGSEIVASLALHQGRGETLMATAHILPDLRLEVEGPGRHELLDGWIQVLQRV